MTYRQQVVIAISKDFLEHISLYQDDIQDEIVSIIYLSVKQGQKKEKEMKTKGGVE